MRRKKKFNHAEIKKKLPGLPHLPLFAESFRYFSAVPFFSAFSGFFLVFPVCSRFLMK
jgi:hypothetical protein